MEPPARIGNKQVAAILYDVADLLETEGVKFKPIAYRRAAHVIETLSEEVADLNTAGKLEEIPGVGSHIANKIREILTTGKLEYYDRLKSEIPRGSLNSRNSGGSGRRKQSCSPKNWGSRVSATSKKPQTPGRSGISRGLARRPRRIS